MTRPIKLLLCHMLVLGAVAAATVLQRLMLLALMAIACIILCWEQESKPSLKRSLSFLSVDFDVLLSDPTTGLYFGISQDQPSDFHVELESALGHLYTMDGGQGSHLNSTNIAHPKLDRVLSSFVKEQALTAPPVDAGAMPEAEDIANRVKKLRLLDEEGAPIQVCTYSRSSAIFDLLAQFLDLCHFNTAAAAIKAQCREKPPPFDAHLVKSFKAHLDNCALLLADLEAFQPKQVDPQEASVHELLDTLLRKLMATGQSLSDEKLLTCIDGALKSNAFPKFALKDGTEGKEGSTLDILNTSDVDAYRFWESISKETSKMEVPVLPEAAEAQPAVEPTPAPTLAQPESSAHYPPKRRNATQQEAWDVNDEYHDDEDPGYRIREIYEAELLAELSQKLGPAKSETTPAGDELSTAAAEQGAEVSEAANPQSPEPGSDSRTRAAGEDAVSEALGATPQGGGDREPRSASPTFGAAPVEEPLEDPTVSAPPPAAEGGGSPLSAGVPQDLSFPQTPTDQVPAKPLKPHFRKDVKCPCLRSAALPIPFQCHVDHLSACQTQEQNPVLQGPQRRGP
ncbi:unnamed protein product [Symbiodinium microadriaticum]|nr:unnamed protein product [Symbiodinium microadriaticum]